MSIQVDRERAVEAAMTQIERQFGKGSIMKLGSQAVLDVPVIPTGSLALDKALGTGGLPRGRVCEIFGPESSGKTTLALHAVAEAHKQGGDCSRYMKLRDDGEILTFDTGCWVLVTGYWLLDVSIVAPVKQKKILVSQDKNLTPME